MSVGVVERVVPRRLGTSFRWLLGSSWATNIGDGVALAAGPLLVASQTRDPFLVAMATLLQQLPFLLFGLYAGAVADRLDRRAIVLVANVVRALVLGLLVASIGTEQVNIGVILAALFLLGTSETFADTTAMTLMPMLVQKKDYGTANSRLMGGQIVANQMIGPPVGAALFAAGSIFPFVTQLVFMVFGILLIARIQLPPHGRSEAEPSRIRDDIREGAKWLWAHGPVRTLAITIFTFNVTFGAAWSVLVLYSQDRLGMGEIGFGLITTASAAGGLVGTLSYGWLERRLSLANIMRGGLILETLTHLVLALTTWAWLALVVFFVFGAHAFIWGTTSSTVRQRAVPLAFQGRVGSVYMTGVMGGMVIGSGVGGVIAQHWGLTAPFWFAFVGSAIILVLIWRQLTHIAHADEHGDAAATVAKTD